MDEFLDSEKFYQMAKEYNEKYGRVESLGVDDKKAMGDILAQVEKICFIVRKTFGGNSRFLLAIERTNDLEKEIGDIKRVLGIVESVQNKIFFSSYKRLANMVANVFNDLFLIESGGKNEKIEIIEKKFFGVISAILAVL